MPTNFQRLRAGQAWRVTQATADAIMESAEHWAKTSRSGGNVPPPSYVFDGTIIQVQNVSGDDMDRFSVAAFDDTLIDPADNLDEFQNYPRFTVDTPTADDAGNWCILIEPIPDQGVGRAIVAGVAPVQIDASKMQSGQTPPYADVEDGKTYLQPAGSGAEVLYCQDASAADDDDLVWAYVRFPAYMLIPFEWKDDITPGGSGEAYPMLPDLSDADTNADTFTVYDDILNDARAFGRDHQGFDKGARGWAISYPVDGSVHAELVNMQRVAKLIKITAPYDESPGATFQVQSCTVLDDGQDPTGGSGGNSINITNWSLQLCSGATAICVQNGGGTTGNYLVIDADCPPSNGCNGGT